MSQKPPFPPLPPLPTPLFSVRPPAPHVVRAMAAAQPKVAGGPLAGSPPSRIVQAAAPGVRQPAPHVARAMAAAQPRAAVGPLPGNPRAPIVQAAPPAPAGAPFTARQVAPHVQTVISRHEHPRASPVRPAEARGPAAVGPVAQPKIFINHVRDYDPDEKIETIDYVRDGNKGGGNHFVSDYLIRTIFEEILVGRTRAEALGIIGNLWEAGGWMGKLVVPKKIQSNVAYDSLVNNVLATISGEKANHFFSEGSGDQGGTAIDVPSALWEQQTVLRFAEKMEAALTGVEEHLGKVGTAVKKDLIKFQREVNKKRKIDKD